MNMVMLDGTPTPLPEQVDGFDRPGFYSSRVGLFPKIKTVLQKNLRFMIDFFTMPAPHKGLGTAVLTDRVIHILAKISFRMDFEFVDHQKFTKALKYLLFL